MRHFAFVLAILPLLLVGCHNVVAPYDPPFYLKGVVYDVSTGQPLSGVTLSWKGPDKADSLIFAGDTLSTIWNQVLRRSVTTSKDGSFVFEFVPCARYIAIPVPFCCQARLQAVALEPLAGIVHAS